MANILPPYIADLVLGFNQRSTEQLESLVALHPSQQAYLPLQNALNSVPEESINVRFIAPILANLPTDTRDNFGSFVIALLKYIRLPDGQDFDSAHAKFQGLVSAYVEANKVFATAQDGIHICACMNPVILALARRLLDLTEHAASLTPHVLKHPQSPRSMRDTTRQTLERSMQIASAQYNPDQWASATSQGPIVGDIIWEMGNILWRIFARRQLYSTAAELDRTFAKLRPSEDDRIRARADYIRHTDICQTYYWRGRLGVKLLNFRGAKDWLDTAWVWCPEDSWQQRRAILIRLIPVNLLLGNLPDPALLRAYSLTQFSPLIHHFRTGNVAAWRKELDEKREWFRRRSIWLLLHERGEILVWRNLLRRSLRIYYQTNPSAPPNRCPTSIILQTVRKAFEGTGEVEDGAVELEDIIVVIASCIDHGLILGYLSYSQNQLVMKPRPDGMGGFPAISTVTPRKIDANQ